MTNIINGSNGDDDDLVGDFQPNGFGTLAEPFIVNALDGADIVTILNADGQTSASESAGVEGRVNGGPGDDVISTSENRRTVSEFFSGGGGVTPVDFTQGHIEIIDAGPGNDFVVANNGPETLDGGEDDPLTGNGDFDTLSYARSEPDILFFEVAAQVRLGQAADLVFNNGARNPDATLRTVDGIVVDAQAGLVTYDGARITIDAMGENLPGQPNTFAENNVFAFTHASSNFEAYVGTRGHDTFLGSDIEFEQFFGGNGDDIFNGRGGFDEVTYVGSGGAQGVVFNFAGSATDPLGFTDTIIDIDAVRGTEFGDTFIGTDADERVRGHGGADFFDGGDGVDTADYSRDGATRGANGQFPPFVGIVADLATGAIVDSYGDTDTVQNVERILGTNADDEIRGSGAAETLRGGPGMDLLIGRGGADALNGGDGDDDLRGSAGGDTLEGAGGRDDLVGGPGGDTLSGGDGEDTLDGGADVDTADYALDGIEAQAGVDIDLAAGGGVDGFGETDTLISIENLFGGALDDTLQGDAFANILRGRAGGDTLRGRAEDDTLTGDDGEDLLDGGEGDGDVADYGLEDGALGVNINLRTGSGRDSFGATDTLLAIENVFGGALGDILRGDAGANLLRGRAGIDTLRGLDGDDVLEGGEDDDDLFGGADDDILRGGEGADDFDGGAGAGDEVDYSQDEVVQGVSVDLGAGEGVDSFGDRDTFTNVERVRGTDFSDTLIGDDADNMLFGEAFNDELRGGGGLDELFGGGGQDDLFGEDGVDTLRGEAGRDDLFGGRDGDFLFGGGEKDILNGEQGDDELNGEAGDDTLNGGVGDDDLSGGSGNDMLSGGNGRDILDGEVGRDMLFGEAGEDLLTARLEDISLDGGSGNDTVLLFSTSNGAELDLQAGTLMGGGYQSPSVTAIENAVGSERNDTLLGDDGANALNGAGGADTLSGRNGADILNGGDGDDTLIGGGGADILNGDADPSRPGTVQPAPGRDTITGGSGDDEIRGGDGNDDLRGQSGNDRVFGDDGDDDLFGGGGEDFLDGGMGTNLLVGGAGEDSFVFSQGVTRIRDYQPGIDVIDVSGSTGGLAFSERAQLNDIDRFASGPGNTIFEPGGGVRLIVEGVRFGEIDFDFG